MEVLQQSKKQDIGPGANILAFIVRIGLAIAIPIIAFFVLYQGFLFLRAGNAPKWVITVVAIIWRG